MSKQILSKMYFFMLLTTLLSSSYTTLCDMFSKDGIVCSNSDIELLDDGGIIDLGETNIEQVEDSVFERVSIFDFSYLGLTLHYFSYLQNTYEIYLGHKTPPPK